METTRGGDYDSEPPRAVASRIDARVLHHARVDRARSRVLDGAARAVVAARATSRTRRGRDATAALARARAVAI